MSYLSKPQILTPIHSLINNILLIRLKGGHIMAKHPFEHFNLDESLIKAVQDLNFENLQKYKIE